MGKQTGLKIESLMFTFPNKVLKIIKAIENSHN